MKKISLQWKLTLLTTVLITILCGCLTFFLYKNGVYYFDTLQESITDQGTEPESVYIDIPDNEWDDFVSQFSMKVYNSKSDYRSRSLLITVIVWRRMEGKSPVRLNAKTVGSVLAGVLGALLLGVGMCLCMVFDKMIPGVIIGLVGILALLMLIPMTKGIHG